MPPHCPQCTGKHQPGSTWHGESEDALWTPLISSPCHPGSGPPPLLPGGTRLRRWSPNLAPAPLSSKLGPLCSLILPATITLSSKEKISVVIHPCTHPSIYPNIHAWIHPFIRQSIQPLTQPFIQPFMLGTIYLPTHPSMYLTILPINLPFHPFIHSPIHSSNHLSSFYLPIHPSISQPIHPIYFLIDTHTNKYMHLFINASSYLFIYLSISPSTCALTHPSIHPFTHYPSTDIFSTDGVSIHPSTL